MIVAFIITILIDLAVHYIRRSLKIDPDKLVGMQDGSLGSRRSSTLASYASAYGIFRRLAFLVLMTGLCVARRGKIARPPSFTPLGPADQLPCLLHHSHLAIGDEVSCLDPVVVDA